MRVNLDSTVWTDARFTVLADLMGWESPDTAIARAAKVWRQCVIESSYVLAPATIDAVLGKGGAVAFVSCGLGEELPGGVRVRGAQGRIEWHKNLKENGRKGGRAKRQATAKAIAKAIASPEAEATALAKNNPPALAPTPTPTPAPAPTLISDPAGAGAPERKVEPAIKAQRKHLIPATWAPTDHHRDIASQFGLDVAYQAEQFRGHATYTNRMCSAWDAAFGNWLRKAAQDGGRQAQRIAAAPTIIRREL